MFIYSHTYIPIYLYIWGCRYTIPDKKKVIRNVAIVTKVVDHLDFLEEIAPNHTTWLSLGEELPRRYYCFTTEYWYSSTAIQIGCVISWLYQGCRQTWTWNDLSHTTWPWCLCETSEWLHDFLKDRSQTVSVNGALSNSTSVHSGVPQGTVLGQLLFVVALSDILPAMYLVTLTSYAPSQAIKGPDNILKLQNDLHEIYKWTGENKQPFNAKNFQSSPIVSHTDDNQNTQDRWVVQSQSQGRCVTSESTWVMTHHLMYISPWRNTMQVISWMDSEIIQD